MPWRVSDMMDARTRFIGEWLAGTAASFAALCRKHGISRETGYQCLKRYRESRDGGPGLKDRSRAPHRHGRATDEETVAAIMRVRRRGQVKLGARKIRRELEKLDARRRWPSVSTIQEILKRRGLVKPALKRRRVPLWEGKLTKGERCNQVWRADYKGYFFDGQGKRNEPLTVSDEYSRALLVLQSCPGTHEKTARKAFKAAFKQYGLPDIIRTDNGSPFAAPTVTGLTRLSIWWLKLGIRHERIDPGCPYQNGSHEYIHRVLKAATLQPPARTARTQDRRFARFRHEYNVLRPHEALGQEPPASLYRPSARKLPARLAPPHYPPSMTVRRVRTNGTIKFEGVLIYIGEVLRGERLGLQQDPKTGRTSLYFYERMLGTIAERDGAKFLFRGPPPPRGRRLAKRSKTSRKL